MIRIIYIFLICPIVQCVGQNDTLKLLPVGFSDLYCSQTSSKQYFSPLDCYGLVQSSSDSLPFTGTLQVCTNGNNLTFEDSTCIQKQWYNYVNGQIRTVEELSFHFDQDYLSSGAKRMQVYYLSGSESTRIRARWFDSGELRDSTITFIKNDSSQSHSFGYSKDGKLVEYGSLVNDEMHGKWVNYHYNDTIKLIEVWEMGKLIDIISDRIIYLNTSNKLIDKQSFWEDMATIIDPVWNIISLNYEEIEKVDGKAFIMYSEPVDRNLESSISRKRILKQYTTTTKRHAPRR